MRTLLYPSILAYCQARIEEFAIIPAARKVVLENIAAYIKEKQRNEEATHLIFICTHNSRRSHFGQIWSAVGAAYYNINGVFSYSGGTEATAFHKNALRALECAGFQVSNGEEDANPHYTLSFGEGLDTTCFSKVYDDSVNPKSGFAAIMTCSDAEENCPLILGTEFRIATTYDDPKAFDNTPLADEKYIERCAQIAREMLYVMKNV